MAYFTGTFANVAAAIATIQTNCQANGWILTGDFLSKGITSTSLRDMSDGTNLRLELKGANSPDGLTTPSSKTAEISIPIADWPITYYLFINDTPETVICVFSYGDDFIQTLMFGSITKVNNAAFVGGNYFYAPRNNTKKGELTTFTELTLNTYDTGAISPNLIPFTSKFGGHEIIYAEIDGKGWTNDIAIADHVVRLYYLSPNQWNNQSQLIPVNISMPMASSRYAHLGYLEHLRLIRITNYNTADIITLGSDTWIVFPWLKKDVGFTNSGDLGFAVKKVI